MKNKNILLTKTQEEVVKTAIIQSMRDVYVDVGQIPGAGFDNASSKVAKRIIKVIQMTLVQAETFSKIANGKKSIKKTKKNVRK